MVIPNNWDITTRGQNKEAISGDESEDGKQMQIQLQVNVIVDFILCERSREKKLRKVCSLFSNMSFGRARSKLPCFTNFSKTSAF